jgi:FtsZ-binding cell division protein ZapB
MPMETVLQKLEAKVEEFIEAHQKAASRVEELEARVAELEGQVDQAGAADSRIEELETQRDQMAERLEKVLAHIDSVLEQPNPTEDD